MKSVLVVLSAAVVTSLGCYFAFSACRAFGLMSNAVVVNVDVFIGFIAVLTLLSASLAMLLRTAVVRADDKLVRGLEARIEQLEQQRRGAATNDG